jgi:hypothetical protein
MRKLAALPLIAVMALLGIVRLCAQDAGGLPKPGAEHAKLAFFVGKWTSEGDLKPSAYSPGGKFTFTEECQWLSGNFAIICHSEGQMSGGTVKGVSIMSYNADAGKYIYFESNSMGQNTYSQGTVSGDTWTWNNDDQMGGKTVHGRFTLTRLNDDAAAYKFEMGAGADPLALIMEGKQTRVK